MGKGSPLETTLEASAPYQCQPHLQRGRQDGQIDGRVGWHTWQSSDFVPSQSTTGQSPFNEFLWSGQPSETIFTLMLWLMAKPASKPARARGSCPHAERTGANSTGKGGWSKRSSRAKEAPLPLPMSPEEGTVLPLHSLGFSLPAAPLAGVLEQLSLEVGCPQRVPHAGRAAASTALGGALSGTKHSNCLTI